MKHKRKMLVDKRWQSIWNKMASNNRPFPRMFHTGSVTNGDSRAKSHNDTDDGNSTLTHKSSTTKEDMMNSQSRIVVINKYYDFDKYIRGNRRLSK